MVIASAQDIRMPALFETVLIATQAHWQLGSMRGILMAWFKPCRSFCIWNTLLKSAELSSSAQSLRVDLQSYMLCGNPFPGGESRCSDCNRSISLVVQRLMMIYSSSAPDGYLQECLELEWKLSMSLGVSTWQMAWCNSVGCTGMLQGIGSLFLTG